MEREKTEDIKSSNPLNQDEIQIYLKDIRKLKVMTPDREKFLAERIISNDCTEREKELIQKEMLEGNLRFVITVAKQYQNQGIDLIDNITTDIYNSNEISSIVNDDYILSYFKKMLTPKKYNLLSMFINNKNTLLLNETINNDLIDECRKKNKEIKLLIDLCNTNTEIKEHKNSFIIKYIEWEGLLCYENKNWLNMHDLDAKTFLIKSKQISLSSIKQV